MAIAGSVVVSPLVTGNDGYGLAIIVLAAFGVVGLVAALLLPSRPLRETVESPVLLEA